MKKIFLLLFFLFFLFLLSHPLWAEGNKFGIHVIQIEDLEKAGELVNSSGGDWGWITTVIRDDEMDKNKWQKFMNECRERHLIPLLRLATHLQGNSWVKPKLEDAEKWADFLNNLNWPVKNQYVIIFNEPNHAKEWEGEINPEEYAQVLLKFKEALKKKNKNFQILNAGFDLAASNSKETMEVFNFWKRMNQKIPEIFNHLDGWASHSYPNHGFVGKPTQRGKTSIRGYQWELQTLKKHFSLKNNLPVFITETGWPKDENRKSPFIDPQTAAQYFRFAFENVWNKDELVVAVTPFILNYPQPPFSEFSWLDKEGKPFPQYQVVKNLPKTNWWPEQEEKYTLGEAFFPPFLLTQTTFKGKISIRNIGQSILGERNSFFLPPIVSENTISITPARLLTLLKPGEEGYLEFEIYTGTVAGEFNLGWKDTKTFRIKILTPTAFRKVELSFWEKIISPLRRYFKF